MFHIGNRKVSSGLETGRPTHSVNQTQLPYGTTSVPVAYGANDETKPTIVTCSNCESKISLDNNNGKGDITSDTMEEFASTTTMHGVSYCYNSKSKPMKGFWIFLLLCMATMLTYQIVDRIIAYFQYETNTSLTQEFQTFLPFPAVTICSFNRFYANIDEGPFLNALHEFNQLITPENVAMNEAIDHKLNVSEISKNLGEKLDIKRLLKRQGFSIDESTMPLCIFKYEECEMNDFTEILTWMGVCYTFNDGNISKIQSISGAGHGFTATINIKSHLNTEQPFYGLASSGLRIQIHERGETPDPGSFGISIPAGRKASIEVSRHDFDLMYEPWGRCNPSQESLVYFNRYTLNNCLQECYTNAVMEHCGCHMFTQYWAAGFGRECTAEEMQNCASGYLITVQQNYSADTCNCTVPCSYTRYDASVSYATFPNSPTTRRLKPLLNLSEDEVQANAVEFDIYFKGMSYTKFSQTKKVDESSLLSDIGGQLGLWLGMSFVTAVELVHFCARKICACRRKKTV